MTATKLPPDAPTLDAVRADAVGPRPSIRVVPSSSAHASAELADALRATGLFDYVYSYDDDSYGAQAADYIATPWQQGFWDHAVPVWTVLSLGIIPSFENRRPGYGFSVVDRRSGTEIPVDATYRSTRVMGWIAVPLGVFPGWAFGDPPPGDAALRILADRLRGAVERLD